MTEPHTTKALRWFEAREQGRRLPEHEIHCGLCGEPMSAADFSQAVRDTTGFDICAQCMEQSL